MLKMELHKEIAAWLAKFKLIQANSKALTPQAEIEDLVAIIRDGVVLCQLVHSLDPGCLDMTRVIYDTNVHGDPAVSDFVCRSNIFLFLKAITSNFNLNVQQHWFEPEDLYLCRNIGQVFSTLSALSHTPKVRKSGIEGFPKKEKNIIERLESERNTYQELNNLYGEAGNEKIYESFIDNHKSIYSTYGEATYGTSGADAYYAGKIGDDIYHTIFPQKAPRLSLNISTKKKKRQFHVNELVDTEDKYLEKLIMVKDKFREKMTLMPNQDKNAIFYSLDELILLHSDLLFDLKPKRVDIGLMFQRHIPRISALYGRYCVNLPQALERLTAFEQKKQNLQQLHECQSQADPPTFPLSSHLVVPFQRFLKYQLLLENILKQTEEDYGDGKYYGNLKLAVAAMVSSQKEVNEMKRDYEDIEKQNIADIADMKLIANVGATIKLMKLENGMTLLDFGRLRKAGEITSHGSPRNNNNMSHQIGDYAFLFDMMIILCHRPKWLQHRYRFREAIKIKDHYLEPPLPNSNRSEFHYVRLFSKVDPRQVTLVLIAKSEQEREAWFNAMVLAMDAVTPSENNEQGHVIQLTTFPEPPINCFHCQKVLSGKFYQGYRCLRCQANLHKRCLAECACLEVGSLKKSYSVSLPTAEAEDIKQRTGSTLTLNEPDQNDSRVSRSIPRDNSVIEDLETKPLEQQSWFAGELSAKTATDRLETLPVGTFMVRKRVNGCYALMLKTPEVPKGVKSMKIEEEEGTGEVYLSHARKFESIQKLISFYRTQDLTENFNYVSLRNVVLKMPYKDI